MFWLQTASAKSPQDLIIPSDIAPTVAFKPKSKVALKEYHADIETLVSAFQNGYGGWHLLRLQLENEIFPRLRSFQKEGASTEVICNFLGETLDKIPDFHVSARTFTVTYVPPCGRLPTRKGLVGPNIKTRDEIPWGYFERDVRSATVPIISMTHMALSANEGWTGFLDKVNSIYKNAPALIIDVRGNGGGDDTKAREMARILYGIEDQSVWLYPEGRHVQRQSAESMGLFANTFLLSMLRKKLQGQELSQDLKDIYAQYMDLFNQALRGDLPSQELTEIPQVQFEKEKLFKGPIRILVDAECGSSCESAIIFFKNHPNAKLVGENSAGVIHFGNMATIWLKNSNVFVTMSTSSLEFKDGTFVEKSGFSPDLHVPSGNDALEFALKDIEEILSK